MFGESSGDLKVNSAEPGVPNKELESPKREGCSLAPPYESGDFSSVWSGLENGILFSSASIASSSLSVGLGTRNPLLLAECFEGFPGFPNSNGLSLERPGAVNLNFGGCKKPKVLRGWCPGFCCLSMVSMPSRNNMIIRTHGRKTTLNQYCEE